MQSSVKVILVLIVLLLIGARFAVRRQARERAELLKAVPRRPLGLDDDPAGQR
ncbi:MAG: hypothetical protein ACRD9L_18620 [Bryobacteraceae bacterium]